ncbi:cytochrome b-c1 complex subunit 7 [Phialemonium atrogriseum]|uniref:Cytochrome b-c1 complex subunit 7 n=1 Tax=Phialemonium atrogriseum TaxID=1093897 RepID=A0AAJ0C7E4_9PEZI|nr:cytochrome b-c1 complex subunit 7 [Phialemonium atrogriseum]KAK1770897.1 cytochrome b-c1 complex subunit 7 [Phialemonium atrogriseum]
MSAPSFAPFVLKRPWLRNMLRPLANWYANAASYRQMGLRADDLISEENETVALALKRLGPEENYDRVFRIRRAVQCSITHKLLPKSEWTKAEDDKPYLGPLIAQIEAEAKERKDLDALTVIKNH